MTPADFFAVVMAGGQGTRLWPFSRRRAPKQNLKLAGGRTLFRETLDRLAVFGADHILVLSTVDQAEGLKEQAPEIPESNYLLEPVPRGTAPVVGWAAVELLERSSSAVMACLPADHLVQDTQGFQRLMDSAYQRAQDGFLVTLGIEPTSPATGYGYIERGEALEADGGVGGYRARSFREKPNAETAREYLRRGSFVWNSGMFFWRADRLLEEMARWMPAVGDGLRAIAAQPRNRARELARARIWPGLERQTLDYGILERADRVLILPASQLGWLDIGNWERLFEVMKADGDGNVLQGDSVSAVETKRSLIFQASGVHDRLIAVFGGEGWIVVDTGDAVLVCPRERAEEVRQLVERLDHAGFGEFL